MLKRWNFLKTGFYEGIKLGEIARAASRGSWVFRGEPKFYPEISSSLYRQYKTMLEPFSVDGFDIRHIQNEILSDAARYTGDLAPHDLLSTSVSPSRSVMKP